MKRTLLVGWDAADWKVIKPLMEEGMMPNLRGLVERGVMGNMATMYPMLSPMLWTTIATGKRPFEHGIHGFSEPDPSGAGVRPITNVSRKCRALWNIATLMGMKANVVGWWPSHPAEPIDGVMVSDFFQKAVGTKDKAWPSAPNAVHPAGLTPALEGLRTHPQDLEGGLVNLFVPKLFEIPVEEQEKSRKLSNLCKEIAECTTICNVAEAAMQNAPWRLTCAYFSAIDHFSHGFMNFYPPKLDWVSQEDFDLYNEVVRSAYIYHDILLGRLLRQTDEQTTVFVISDHGFHSDHLRPRNLPDEPAGPAEQHRHYGIFVAAGPGIKQDELIFGATLLNICPTVLTAMGLPVGEDMEGGVLNIFEDGREAEYLPTWEAVEGEDGRHPAGLAIDPVDSHESMKQLIELGYVDALPENALEAIEVTTRELRYNLARSYMEAALHVDAAPIFAELFERWPYEHRFGIALVNCYLALGQAERAAPLLDQVEANKAEDMQKAIEEAQAFREEHKEALEKLKAGEPGALDEAAQAKLRKLNLRGGRNPIALFYLRGVVAAALNKRDEAIEHLERARKGNDKDLKVLLKLANVYLAARRAVVARGLFEEALTLDPENADALLGLARTYLFDHSKAGAAKALEAARRSVGLVYFNPLAHYILGDALLRNGEEELALKAWQSSVGQNPNFPEAYLRMARLHAARGQGREAQECRGEARAARARLARMKKQGNPQRGTGEIPQVPMPVNAASPLDFARKDTVVVVSGLPRSGTSMMMQMLAAGGMETIADGERAADDDNPLGYFEDERVKKLGSANEWLGEARGKAVKIVAPLLPRLKAGLRYKVVFMWRSIEEILRSQETMIQRTGHKGGRSAESLGRVYAAQLRRYVRHLGTSKGIDVLYVDYRKTTEEPEATAAALNEFLGGTLNTEAMVRAVRPDLYRQRTDSKQ